MNGDEIVDVIDALIIAQYYVGLRWDLPGCPEPTPPPTFTEFQEIETDTATDWEHFIIDGEHYLAIANLHNFSESQVESKILKWNGSNFVTFQKIPTHGAEDWEYFSIRGPTLSLRCQFR